MKGRIVRMNKQCMCVILMCMVVVSAGCSGSKISANFNLDNRRVTIVTEPAGATVRQLRPMGQPSSYLGKTPLNDQTVLVLIQKDGYEPYTGTLRVEKGETVVHEIELQKK